MGNGVDTNATGQAGIQAAQKADQADQLAAAFLKMQDSTSDSFDTSITPADGSQDLQPDQQAQDQGQLDTQMARGQDPRTFAANLEKQLTAQVAARQRLAQSSLAGLSVNQANALSFDSFVKQEGQGQIDAANTVIMAAGGVGSTAGGDDWNSFAAALTQAGQLISNPNWQDQVGGQPGELELTNARVEDTWNKMQAMANGLDGDGPPVPGMSFDKYEQLEMEYQVLRKEQEKLEAEKDLIWEMLLGNPSPATIQKLKEMGLGQWADSMLEALVKEMRKAGGVSPLVMQVLESMGYGYLVQADETAYKQELAHQANAAHGIATTMDERFTQQQALYASVDAQHSVQAASSSLANHSGAVSTDTNRRLLLARAMGQNASAVSSSLGVIGTGGIGQPTDSSLISSGSVVLPTAATAGGAVV
jgi:hypothetical protein